MKKVSALRYKPEEDRAPVYIGSWSGHWAKKVLALADQYGIPIVVQESLQQELSSMKPGSEIPEELFLVVVEIYQRLWQMRLWKSDKFSS